MATLIKNADPDVPECIGSEPNMAIINNRIAVEFDLHIIRDETTDLQETVSASENYKIRNIKKATTFPIADIKQLMAQYPSAVYMRVYNGFTTNGKFITYMVALDKDLKTYDDCRTTTSCCHCSPCLSDRILND